MRVAIYARVSTKDKGQSTDNQLPYLRRYAAAHGYEVYQEYVEEESGGTGNRGQFKAMLSRPAIAIQVEGVIRPALYRPGW
ncbi:recombinase family protein [Hymenobacter elongatus]|uniref:Resolvase/invertase-type recombinase catalytic domain-containing protein n=1 Tax=Hymenobacter elongatus TaxID=877208 RepID=A0A4Z0PG98_9BACT|nr:recombinase family protein [Hymenobacter elongatus]TGE14154.1 hypothetical protein E5J99_17115 [Hymenobacter elongatus]